VPRICGSSFGGWISPKVFWGRAKEKREEGDKKAARIDE